MGTVDTSNWDRYPIFGWNAHVHHRVISVSFNTQWLALRCFYRTLERQCLLAFGVINCDIGANCCLACNKVTQNDAEREVHRCQSELQAINQRNRIHPFFDCAAKCMLPIQIVCDFQGTMHTLWLQGQWLTIVSLKRVMATKTAVANYFNLILKRVFFSSRIWTSSHLHLLQCKYCFSGCEYISPTKQQFWKKPRTTKKIRKCTKWSSLSLSLSRSIRYEQTLSGNHASPVS